VNFTATPLKLMMRDAIVAVFDMLGSDTVIGHGQCGKVHKFDETRAVKVIRVGGLYINPKAAIREIEIMARLYV
jgi:hypothetical protein